MKVRIEPSVLKGSITAPPSKSYAHRMLICGALSDGTSTIKGISESEDMNATLDCIKALGAETVREGDKVHIGVIKRTDDNTPFFSCRESGSTLRFMIPVALAFYDHAVFEGSKRLIERGIGVYEEVFAHKGITVNKSTESIEINGRLVPGEYRVRGDVSSQYITGLMMALPLLDADSVIHITGHAESRPYIHITMDVLRLFGIDIEEINENEYHIRGRKRFADTSVRAEGDWSNAAFLYALKYLGNDIDIKGLNGSSRQGDRACLSIFEALDSGNLKVDLSDCPDLGPVMFAYAALKSGGVFTGTRRLRIKESDRVLCMQEELSKFGIKTEITENTFTVIKGELKRPKAELSSHNDHRIAMALSVIASVTGGTIDGSEAVRKSYPDFYDVMRKLGMEVFDETT
ncbi:MAG: 3-phosphoshikimate 1-carboxyvinyltransferase [Lachnospiraceae bacterium]|nr:3-phosphoshikimate 1-carboxyvinyltransferase [Lachnospiraceae bacterium]